MTCRTLRWVVGVAGVTLAASTDDLIAIHNLSARTSASGTFGSRAPKAPPLVSTAPIALDGGDGGWRAQLPARASAVWRIPR